MMFNINKIIINIIRKILSVGKIKSKVRVNINNLKSQPTIKDGSYRKKFFGTSPEFIAKIDILKSSVGWLVLIFFSFDR